MLVYDKVYKDRVSLQKTDHLGTVTHLRGTRRFLMFYFSDSMDATSRQVSSTRFVRSCRAKVDRRWREISDSDSDVASPMSDGSLEETYHSFSYTPLFAEIDGPIIGLLAVDAETTDTVIAQRYLHSAREVGLAIAPAMLPKQLYRFICDGFDRNPIDVPWSLVYSVSKHISSSIDSLDPSGSVNDGATLRGGKKATTASYHTTTASSDSPSTIEGTLLLRLQAASGLKANYTQNYAQFLINMSDNSDRSDADFPFPLHRAVLEKDPTHVYIGPHIMDHFEPRSWDSATHQVRQ